MTLRSAVDAVVRRNEDRAHTYDRERLRAARRYTPRGTTESNQNEMSEQPSMDERRLLAFFRALGRLRVE